jgi:DNA-binding XRE family transcriptional regulator
MKNGFAKYRRWLDMTQAEMAKKIGITQAAICQIEAGKRLPSFAVLDRMRKTLSLTADELMDLFGRKDSRND